VDCVGRLAPDELARYLSASDVALMPSESESFGLAALEAMACGTPVVGSRCGGLEEVVAAVDAAIEAGDEPGLGRRFPPLARLLSEVGDVAGMVEAIRALAIEAERSPADHRALSVALVRGAGEAFPRGVQLSAYAAILSRAVRRRADDDGVRAAG
jgi:glycosyltransferase involved in cell wall biosynthesis